MCTSEWSERALKIYLFSLVYIPHILCTIYLKSMIEICGGPFLWGPLGSCPLCPLLNPALMPCRFFWATLYMWLIEWVIFLWSTRLWEYLIEYVYTCRLQHNVYEFDFVFVNRHSCNHKAAWQMNKRVMQYYSVDKYVFWRKFFLFSNKYHSWNSTWTVICIMTHDPPT